MNRNAIPRLLVLSVVAVAACDSIDPSQPTERAEARVPVVADPTDQSALARAIPGYGGMYVDANGTPTVYLTDVRQAARARAALAELAEEQGMSPDRIVVVQANYRMEDLSGWYNRTWADAMDVAGAVFSDLDEANNRILFGVEHAGAAHAVRGIAARAGVPTSAVEVRVVEPVQLAATLRDRVRPIVGGLQIHFGNYLCTLGFNANAGGEDSFITNSHCTNNQGGVEGTQYYQPTSSVDGTVIATEVADPVYVRGGGTGCPRSKRCRYSDSSRARYAAGTAFQLGGIANVAEGSITITGTTNITGEADATRTPVAVGQTVTKVGRSSGRSTGTVTNTCVNTGVQGSNIMQLCQTFVTATVVSGDSGSQVMQGSTLVGILWGGSGNQFVFSPLKSIKDELGAFVAH
jgi:hypothetical protein